MEQYINKSALVEKIKELDNYWHISKSVGGEAFVESLLSFIDTFEVKEVDFEQVETTDEHWQEVRERAAIAALQGLSANPSLVYDNGEEKIDLTARAMRYSDELIEELKKKNDMQVKRK